VRLSDVLRGLGADSWGVAALLLFLTAFILIAWRTFSRRRRKDYERASRLPLENE
jgi:cbb3-type cytochrome oxidase subunit 3